MVCRLAPGMIPTTMAAGRLLEKNAKLTANLHLTPREEGGSSKIKTGLYWAAKGTDDQNVHPLDARSKNQYTAGENIYFSSAEFELPYDAIVFGLIPCMHLCGKDMKFTGKDPDGREKLLLDSVWNNDWQVGYNQVKPYNFAKGMKILVTEYFDNSSKNANNLDSTKNIRWGNGVADEMFIGYVDYMPQVK